MHVFYTDTFTIDLPAGHRFPIEKYGMLRQRLTERGVLRLDELTEAPLARREELASVHTPEYLDAVFNGTLDVIAERRIGLPWTPQLLRRSLASVGGTQAAAYFALEDGIAGNLAGGTHHAFADHGEGYCVFNDLAVVSRKLLRERRARRILIVDLDVHQGNGTAAIFQGDREVFTFSIHGERNFPFQKVESSLDVALPDGTHDAEYLAALDHHLPPLLEDGFDFIFYQAGVDALASDRLGRLSLSRAGLVARDHRVFAWAKAAKIPLVITLGGGYSQPIEETVESHLLTYATAKQIYGL